MQFTRRGFVTGGTWCVDHNLLIESWPREESATKILGNNIQGGGSGCNFAVGVRKLAPEIPVATIGLIGKDADGARLRGIARQNGVDDTRLTETDAVTTHRTLAFTARDNGRRTHLFEADSSDELSPDHFDFAGLGERMLHLGLPGTHARLDNRWGGEANGWVAILKKAKAAGLETNLELMSIAPARIAELVRPCLPHLDYLVVNDAEIGALAGIETVSAAQTDTRAVDEAMRAVLAAGAMRLLVVHFPMGAIALTREGRRREQPSVAVPREEAVGANGAGDAFAAGLFSALHRGAGLDDGLALAHAAAAASLRSSGTTDSVESAEACLALAARWGWRTAVSA